MGQGAELKSFLYPSYPDEMCEVGLAGAEDSSQRFVSQLED